MRGGRRAAQTCSIAAALSKAAATAAVRAAASSVHSCSTVAPARSAGLRQRKPRRVTLARRMLGWPKICKLAHAFLCEYS